jgi:hypothetical protein
MAQDVVVGLVTGHSTEQAEAVEIRQDGRDEAQGPFLRGEAEDVPGAPACEHMG